MSVSLREITPENFKECIDLKVSDTQSSFVSPNVLSIAQSKVNPTVTPMAVYAGEEMVGFVMFGLVRFGPDKDDRFYISRLMIDERQQGKGFGKAAALAAIEKMRESKNCREIYLNFVPENTNAETLYKNIGFEPTGEINKGEIVMRFSIDNNVESKSAIQNPKLNDVS